MTTFLTRVSVVQALRHAKSVQLAPVQLSVVLRRDFTLPNHRIYFKQPKLLVPSEHVRYLSSNKFKTPNPANAEAEAKIDQSDEKNAKELETSKLTLFQRFKQMYRDYWYVLVPVHLITSAGWFGGFYYMAKSGIDVVAIMESYNVSSKLLSPLKDSSLGYVAIAYAMYKIATPVRYTVTLGGTTISINYLQKWGYIKPVPTREQLKMMYNNKRENLIDTVKDKRQELRLKKEQLKDRTDNLIDDMERKIVTKINDTKKKTTNTIEKP